MSEFWGQEEGGKGLFHDRPIFGFVIKIKARVINRHIQHVCSKLVRVGTYSMISVLSGAQPHQLADNLTWYSSSPVKTARTAVTFTTRYLIPSCGMQCGSETLPPPHPPPPCLPPLPSPPAPSVSHPPLSPSSQGRSGWTTYRWLHLEHDWTGPRVLCDHPTATDQPSNRPTQQPTNQHE